MKNSRKILALGLATSVCLSGCGKKDEPAPSAATPDAAPTPAAEATPAPEAPAPVAAAPTPPPVDAPVESQAVPAQDVPSPNRQAIADIALQKLKEVKVPKNETERFQRNVQWLTLIKNGDAKTKAEIMKQIRDARLTGAEAVELEKLRQYYGVRF